MPTIAVLNVNSTTAMTERMTEAARAAAGPDIALVPLTPPDAPAAVEGDADAARSAVAMLDVLAEEGDRWDAVVLAGVGDAGAEALREVSAAPVVDVTEAAAATALTLGESFSFVTTGPRAIGMIRDRLAVSGLDGRLASVRASGLGVLELEGDGVADILVGEAARAVGEDGAEVICLGCCGMAGLAAELSARLGVPVVDPVAAAVAQAAGIVRQRLTTSRVRRHARPAAMEAAR